jgi:hypothetical protein
VATAASALAQQAAISGQQSICAATCAATQVVWNAWNSAYTTTGCCVTVSYGTNAQAWGAWNQNYQYVYVGNAPATTPAEQAEAQRIAKEINERRRQAKEKATLLLMENLDSNQREQFQKAKTFIVHSRDGQRRYQIEYGIAGNVKLLREDGKPVTKFCIHPEDYSIPVEDVMLAQKLMIEAAEDEFIRIANKTKLAA